MMLELDGYTGLKSLWESANGDVHVGIREQDNRRVVLKRYRRDDGPAATTKARRERDLLARIAGDGVPLPLDLIESLEAPILVLEYVPGIHLAAWADSRQHSPAAHLKVALQLARILARVHHARLIHRDVTPYNVVIDPDTLTVHLIDFGLAQPLGSQRENSQPGGSHHTDLVGTLKFMAPEQTGRMNRGVDTRSDLYALGATLYLVLTGHPVFDLEDPLALIHAHMARVPVPPRNLGPWIPEAISRIVLKLLRKEPDDRYPSAVQLQVDLQYCLDQLESTGAIDPDFEPGTSSVPDHPVFRSVLHGREHELSRLQNAYAHAAHGRLQVLTLSGESGLGKSGLVDGLRPDVLATQGYLTNGRFDAFNERPFAGLTAALNALIEQLLLESNDRLAALRNTLISDVGVLLPTVVELLPDLRFIVGETAPATPMRAAEARARLVLALERLLRVCATPEHPLALFLDDMQWSDPESRLLLSSVLPACGDVPLLVIASYRSEDGGERAQQEWTEDLGARGVDVERIVLKPLDVDTTARMVSDVLHRPPDADARVLAELIHRKTGGNPLHIRQFIEHIHASGLLRLDASSVWTWEWSEIAAAQIPDGAVALMVAKLDRLDPYVRAVLEFAACIGDEFDLGVLRELGNWAQDELESALQVLTDSGILAPCSGGVRFVHDRLREAAQSRMGETQRTRLHYDTARLLITRTPEDQRPERALEILAHLNRGRIHLSEDLRLEAVRLNILGGKKNLAAGAAASAYALFGVGIELLYDDDWHEQRSLAFELLLHAAESALQCGQLDASLELLAELDRRSPTRFEFAQIAVKRIQIYGVSRTPDATVRYMLEVLRSLGVRWQLHPARWRAKLALRWVQWRLGGRDAEKLLLPTAQQLPKWLAPFLVTGQGGGTLARHDTYLTVLASCLVMRTYLRDGHRSGASFTLAAYAYWVYLLLGDSRSAHRLAQTALAMSDREPDPVQRARSKSNVHMMLFPWLMRRLQAIGPLERISETLSELGEVEWAYYARFLRAYYLALAGVPIQRSQQILQELIESVRRAALRYPEPEACEGAYRLLATAPAHAELEAASAADDAWGRNNPGWARPYAQTLWLLVLCVHSRYDLAFEKSLPLERLVKITPYVHIADHTFYRGLSAAVLATDADAWPRRRYRRVLRESARRLKGWARHGPDFVHMNMLLEAEDARLRRKLDLADRLYTGAAKRAQVQDFMHHAALACERHASMLIEARRLTQGTEMLKRSAAHYRSWGATAKADTLENRLA